MEYIKMSFLIGIGIEEGMNSNCKFNKVAM